MIHIWMSQKNSSSSGEIKDRTVEPFAFAAGQKTVWCYEASSKANKVFKVDRISNVEIKAERWEYETHHRQGKMDIFRMTGDSPINVKLQLSLMAKNILVEEYPDAEKDLIPTDDDNIWMLDTQVYRMEGLGRFYMGLAGEIQIIEEGGKLIWECPHCKNRDQKLLNVARRTCGYIGTQFWNQGRTQEIKDRVLHLSNGTLCNE